jgi:hypothetical protein
MHFCCMARYPQHLQWSHNQALISFRLTRCGRNASLGCRFGDCHSDNNGAIGDPHIDHVHGLNFGNCWPEDNKTGHTLFMSDCFLIWPQPIFYSTRTIGRSRYGHNINPNNLQVLLK